MIYVPEGCAHGFLTLEDKTEVFYQMSEFYSPELARGVRWDDPTFQIVWPEKIEVISERDRKYADFEPALPPLNEVEGKDLTEIGRESHRFAAELYPICRSITGEGLRQTLAAIQKRIPLQISEVTTFGC